MSFFSIFYQPLYVFVFLSSFSKHNTAKSTLFFSYGIVLINISVGRKLFGQQLQPSTNGIFGSTNQDKTFGFGLSSNQGGLYGQQAQQQTDSSLFQSDSLMFKNNSFKSQTTGTIIKFNPVIGTDYIQKNGVTQLINTKQYSITLMKQYENKSFEELRFEDYLANRKGPQHRGFGSTSFTASPTTVPSIFGQTNNKTVFGRLQAFGQTPSFGQTTPAFGTTNLTNPSKVYVQPNIFGTTSSISSFGLKPTPASKLFNSTQTQKPLSQSSFGTATTQAQSTFGTRIFGQTNTQVNHL